MCVIYIVHVCDGFIGQGGPVPIPGEGGIRDLLLAPRDMPGLIPVLDPGTCM